MSDPRLKALRCRSQRPSGALREAQHAFTVARDHLPLRLRGSDIRELLINPQFVDARRALEIGLVNRMVPHDDLRAVGEALAAQILETGSSESIARTKRLLLDVLGRPLGESLSQAAEVNAAARATDDCKRGIATFLETKKPPKWR